VTTVIPPGLTKTDRRTYILRMLLWIGLVSIYFLPFLDKAFHIDDPYFLEFSRMIGWNPLKATPEDLRSMGNLMKGTLPYELTHPILVPYLMKISRSVFGEGEIAMHAFFLLFPLIAVFAVIRITRMIYPERDELAMIVPLFFLSMPAFLVNAQNVMTDVPTHAFLLASTACYLYALKEKRPAYCYIGAFFLLAAASSSYQMMVFFPLIAGYGFLRRRLTFHVMTSVLMALAVIVAWTSVIYLSYGVIPLLKSRLADQQADLASIIAAGYTRDIFIGKVISIFSHIGAATFFVVLYRAVTSGQVIKTLLKLAGTSALCLSVMTWYVSYSWGNIALLSLLMGTGLLSVVEIIMLAVRAGTGQSAHDTMFLTGWALMVIMYNIVVLSIGTARYILPALLPIMLLLLSGTRLKSQHIRVRVAAICFIGLSLVFGWLAAYADYRYANSYREFAREIGQFRQDSRTNAAIWYVGEWGMQYYLDRNGAQYLFQASQEPKKGDYVVVALMPWLWKPSPQVTERLILYATREYHLRLPLRLFNIQSNAGFYGHDWGLLPFAFSREPLEVFEIWEVQ